MSFTYLKALKAKLVGIPAKQVVIAGAGLAAAFVIYCLAKQIHEDCPPLHLYPESTDIQS